MSDDQQQLYQRLQRYELHDPDHEIGFVDHLMRSNGWSHGFALRAIEEYKRFVFLAMVADHPVTPSDQIDQVWHLHLLYSDAYWNDFCPRVLGRPLHHNPTRGGPDQRQHFQRLYRATIASYRRHFGDPPVDLWPPVDVRFGRDLQMQRRRISPPAWSWFRFRGWPALLILVLMLLGAAAVRAQDAWFSEGGRGDDYGPLYFIAFVCVVVATSLLTRQFLRPLLRRPARKGVLPHLSNHELACLAGGAERVLLLTLAELVRQGLIIPVVANRSLVLLRDRIGPLQGLALEMVTRHRSLTQQRHSAVNYADLMIGCRYRLEPLMRSLQQRQLILAPFQRHLTGFRWLSLSFGVCMYLGPVLLFSAVPSLVGFLSHHPHQDFIDLVFSGCVLGFHAGLWTPSRRTLWGDVVLQHEEAASAHGDVLRRIAVIGPAALTEGRLDSLRLLIEGVRSDNASSCGCGC